MKRLLLSATLLCTFLAVQGQNNPLSRLKDKAIDRVNQHTEEATDKALDKAEHPKDKQSETATASNDADNNSGTANTSAAPTTLKTYNNYDFIPGDKILFEDNFRDDQDGEFASKWSLEKGQAVVNKQGGIPTLAITEGNYGAVAPRLKTTSYLTDPFTLEFDYYINDGGQYGIIVFLNAGEDKNYEVHFNGSGEVGTSNLDKDFSASYPGTFSNGWHHGAVAFKNGQMKCYLDQYRVLVVPNVSFKPTSLSFGGIGSNDAPIIFSNVRVASGGGMNMLGKKFTDSKIVTHGINFDYNQASIKPESMGTLNMISKLMQENPELKFEVGGHTDGDGDAAYNQKLSQQRADAVRAQLVNMGIDAARLTAKGYGKTKPISDNTTPEGKANNRRVEFVKI